MLFNNMSFIITFKRYGFTHIYIYIYIYINKSDLLFHVVKHDIMEKLINKYICFFENFPNHHILDKLDSHE